MTLFCKVVEVLQDFLSEYVDKKYLASVPRYSPILVENREFLYPLAFDAPGRGVSVGILPPLWYGKTRMAGLPDGEKTSTIYVTG